MILVFSVHISIISNRVFLVKPQRETIVNLNQGYSCDYPSIKLIALLKGKITNKCENMISAIIRIPKIFLKYYITMFGRKEIVLHP